jgi:DNA polymerase-1
MKKFLIVDGNSLIHRAFYALPLLSNAQGDFTNAAYGFTTMFTKILAEEQPDYVIVCFDKGKVTFRTEQFQDYKGHRKATPPELRPQFPLVKRILAAMNVAFVELEGYEADDLIGTMVQKGEEAGFNNLVLTGDKDALQLVSDRSTVLLIRKGISDLDRYDRQAVLDRYGLEPKQIIDLKGLMGDASDNIPGVPGIGEKTALKLLHRYGTVEGIYEHLNEITSKLGEKLRENRSLADLSKKLASIECCVPMEIDFSQYQSKLPDYDKLLAIYKELDFKSLIKGILDRMAAANQGTPSVLDEEREEKFSFNQISDINEIREILHEVDKSLSLAIYVTHRGDYFQGDVSSLSFAFSGHDAYAVFEDNMGTESFCAVLKMIFQESQLKKIVYNAKELQVMLAHKGIKIREAVSDVMLGAYLLNPGASEYSLESLSLEYLNKALVTRENEVEDHARRAQVLLQLNTVIERKIREQGMEKLYREVELPLEMVLAEMEFTGVKVDGDMLKTMSGRLEGAISEISREIYRLAGEEFNINSPKQLGGILFEKLGLPPLKKTKTGYSTNGEVLEHLAERHEIAAKIIEHRMLVKLKSTYVDGMQSLINPQTGKLHTSFNQTVTATGRLSSTEPNLQNIPIRMELGRQIRKVFVPGEKENLLLAGDYSQIELRVLAHISGDLVLQEAFRKDQDIHARTASEVFGVHMEQVDGEMRRRAKAVNFGIIYGISDYGLARELGITRKEAKKYIDSYFARYQGVAEYLRRVVAEAKNTGYVTTILNRRRYLPDIFSSNYNVRSFGERTAMNTPIQGSAADIIKVAMVNVFNLLKEKGYRSKMILQVHDELIFEVVPEEMKTLAIEIKNLMENAISLDVPLKVDLKWGKDWYQMNKYQI